MSDFYSIRSALSRIDECGCDGENTTVTQTTGPSMTFSISYTLADGSNVNLAVNDLNDFVQKANYVRSDPTITSYHMTISESK